MCGIGRKSHCALIVLTVDLVFLGMNTAMAQTTEPPVVTATVPPAYIGELLKAGDLMQEQVDQMRTDGYDWGEVRLATLLARQIAADSDGGLPPES